MGKISEFYNALMEYINDEDKIVNYLVEEISNSICDDLDEMFEKNINTHFYDRYKPHRYRRKKSLFDAYKITKTKTGVKWDFSSEYMQKGLHRVDNEYIFQNSFIKGFHGGADRINNVEKSRYKQPHPNEGTPYWRTPFPNSHLDVGNPYQFWYSKPAIQEAISPMEGIERDLINYFSGKKTSTGKNYKNRVKDAFSLMKTKYRVFDYLKG